MLACLVLRFPLQVLYAMEHVLNQLLDSVGRSGVLLLMCSTDRFGFTPADYIKPENQSNWRRLVDNMFDWGSAPAKGESDTPAAPGNSAGPSCSVPCLLKLTVCLQCSL